MLSKTVILYTISVVPTGKSLYAYAAIPTITQGTLASNSLLNTNARPLLRFTVTGNGGDIAWGMLTFKVTKVADVLVADSGSAGATLWDVTSGGNTPVTGTFLNGSEVYGATTSCADNDLNCDIRFTATAEQIVSGSKTYELRANITVATTAGDYVTTTLDNDSSAVVASDQLTDIDVDTDAPIIWSDMSAASHALTTDDWTSDFGVKNLPVADSLNWPA